MEVKLFVNSLPKSGTNLLQRMVELIGFKYSNRSIAASSIMGKYKLLKTFMRGNIFGDFGVNIGLDYDVCVSNKWLAYQLNINGFYYLSGHSAYSEYLHNLLKLKNIQTLHIIRDPRDVIISSIFYTQTNKQHLLYKFCKNMKFDELFYLYLYGGKIGKYYINSYKEILLRTIKWYDKENVLIIKFEDIVGEKGGGDDEKQYNVLLNVKDFLNIDFDLIYVRDNLYGKSKTFRKGKIFQWKNELDNKLIYDINNFLGDEIKKMGYDL